MEGNIVIYSSIREKPSWEVASETQKKAGNLTADRGPSAE